MSTEEADFLARQREIFLEALSIRDSERQGFLDEACGEDGELRAAVETLVANHADDSFLAEPAVEREIDAIAEGVGSKIGRYRLIEEIGRGGMGVVFRAVQKEPVRREMALKVIKAGMDTREVIARFEAERQALAMMDHPNIARIFDADATQSGRPYFVMELVRGVPITRFCDENTLSTRERLSLFIDVCSAVQHAHQKGIIHRDIKPNNILVAMSDDRPMPKIIDFGVAKATAGKLTDHTVFTRFHHFIGTPDYMSPEQARMDVKDVDTRTDIYALGVLLYKLLTGKTPFDTEALMTIGQEAVLQTIREEEPPKPSTRLNNLTKEERTATARLRREAPEKLPNVLRGDLDWVAMKALEKDRRRRYETANALALDVQRYLDDEPVTAVAPSALYMLRKFAKRNKLAFGTAAAVVAALVLGLSVAVVALVREREARAEAAKVQFASDKLQYASDMKLAMAAFGSADMDSVYVLLDRHTPADGGPDLRGWEWRYLDQFRHQEIATLRPGKGISAADVSTDETGIRPEPWEILGEGISEVDVSPDGCTIVVALTSTEDNWMIQFIDATSLETFDAISMPEFNWVGGFVFDLPGGQSLAVEGEVSGVRLVDFETKGTTPLLPEKWFHLCWPPKLSSDGKWMVGGYPAHSETVRYDRGVGLPQRRLLRCIDVESQDEEAKAEFSSPDGRMLDHELRISPDVKLVAVACADSTVKLFSMPDLELVKPLNVPGSPTCLRWSGDSKSLAVACELPNIVQVWDIPSGDVMSASLKHSLTGVQKSPSYDVCLSGDGSLLATGSYDKLIILWDLLHEPPVEHAIFRGHRALPSSLAFFPDGKRLVSADQDGFLKLWDTSAPKESLLRQLADDEVGHIAFSPNGNLLAVAASDGVVRLFEPQGEKLIATLQPPSRSGLAGEDFTEDSYPALCFSTNGRFLVAGNGDHTATIYDVLTRAPLRQLQGHTEVIHDVAISPDGKTIFTVSEDATLKSWDTAGGAALKSTPNPSEEALYAIDCSADGKLLAVGGKQRALTLRDAATHDILTTLPERPSWRPPSINSICFSPNGKLLVCGLQNEMMLLEVPSLRTVKTFSGLVGPVSSVDFTPDGENLIGVSERGASQMVNLKVMHAVGDLAGSDGRLISARFSPDGRSLAVSGVGAGIRMFRADDL